MVYLTKSYDAAKVLDPAASVFVAANAGAGKTSLLTNRVLRLLLHGVSPARILCLTFTNAAAAEMSNRVLKELGTWVMEDEAKLSAHLAALTGTVAEKAATRKARNLFASVLESPEGIRIQTIHGFCQSILRRFPIEAGIVPHFTVVDTRTEQELLAEARLRLFQRAQKEDPRLQAALASIARRLAESSFHSLIDEIIANKRRFRVVFAQTDGVEKTIREIRKMLSIPEGCTLQALVDKHFAYDDKTLRMLCDITRQLLSSKAKTDMDTGQGMANWLEASPPSAERVADYLCVFMTVKGEPRQKLFNKQTLTDAAAIEALLAEQQRVARFHNAANALQVAESTIDMLHLADALLSLYNQLKNTRALMDYDDLILHACALLGKKDVTPWVLYKLDGGIDHILVDEAQDTSPEQWAIIDALTQEFFSGVGAKELERSLFVVGDEKQSIFSFQGADPAALGGMREYFMRRIQDAAKPVHAIGLTHSFRSACEVLAAVDTVFAQDKAKAGIMFQSDTLAHIPTRLEHAGLVELWPLLAPDEEEEEVILSATTKLARAIASSIRQWIDEGVMLDSRGRVINAGDIMILVRTRTSLVDKLVRALKKMGIPVAGHDRMALGDNLAIQDLIALGQCLLLPEDDLTLACVLKSPIFSLNEEELLTLAWNRGKQSLWERLKSLSADHAHFAPTAALLTDLMARVDFLSPYELYTYLLDTLGMRRCITGRMGEEYNDPIDEFLGQALLFERSHPASMQGFLHWLSASDSEIKRDMEQVKNAVRIMTVHGAKGLQAPIVIMPDTTEIPKLRDTLLWHDADAQSLPFWPVTADCDDEVCASLRNQERQAMLAESRRLLYVAMTRAEDRLYICGASGKEKLHEQSWYELVKGGLVSVGTTMTMPWGEGIRLGQPPVATYAKQSPLSYISIEESAFPFLTRQVPQEPTPPYPLVPSRLAAMDPPVTSPLNTKNLYRRGNLIHRLLQYLPAVPASRRERAAQAIAAGFTHDMPQTIAAECIREVEAIIHHPEFSFLFGVQSLAEVPVAGCVTIAGKEVAVSGQIDRLYVGENEVWVVDFKSNRQPPEKHRPAPAVYVHQMQLYRLLLQKIYPEKTIICALLWTAAPAITILDKALLDEVSASSYI